MGFRVLGDLQQDLGKTQGRAAAQCRARFLRVLWGVLLGCLIGRV